MLFTLSQQTQAALASASEALKLMKAAVPAAPQRDITVLLDYMLTLTRALPVVVPREDQHSTDVTSGSSSSSKSSAAQQQQVCTLLSLDQVRLLHTEVSDLIVRTAITVLCSYL